MLVKSGSSAAFGSHRFAKAELDQNHRDVLTERQRLLLRRKSLVPPGKTQTPSP